MLPVDWAALLLLGLPFTCVCFAGAPATWATIAAITGVGTLYIMARVSFQPPVALHLRAQLAAAALVTIAATVGASVVFFHPHHRWWYRPHWLYGWLAAIPLGIEWFASVRTMLWRRERRKQGEDRDAVVPSA